jgi:integrase
MAKNKTTVRLHLRIDRINKKNGSAPIHIVYQIQGQKKYYAIPGITILEANWDASIQRAVYIDKKAIKQKISSISAMIEKPGKEDDEITKLNRIKAGFETALKFSSLLLSAAEVEELNGKLERHKADIRDIEKRIILNGEKITTEKVINALKDQNEPETERVKPGINIVDFIERFMKETTDHKEGTIKEYRGLANKMKEYENLKKVKFTFEGDAAILKGFSSYLTTVKEVNNITKAKLFSTFKTILRHAKKSPYKIKSNIEYFEFTEKSLKRKDGDFEVIALTEEEFEAIYSYDFSENKSLDEARDIFCFSCVTGLRYGDLEQLGRKHIRKDNTIVIPASDKNDKAIEIPLNPISYAILQKYADRQQPLPVTTAKQKLISNQKLNEHIKKIGELAGIDTEIEMVRSYGLESISLGMFPKYEWLSIHTGRKTFTTLSLARGMALQEVMAITTHSSYKAVKRYIDVTKDRRKIVMANAWGEVPKSKLKAV